MACCKNPDRDVNVTETSTEIITVTRCRNCGDKTITRTPKIRRSPPGGG